jgi:hypothetical protein
MTLPGRSTTIVVEPLREPAHAPQPAVPEPAAPDAPPAPSRAPDAPVPAPEEVPA